MGRRLLKLFCLLFTLGVLLAGAALLYAGHWEREAKAQFSQLRLQVHSPASPPPSSGPEAALASPSPEELYGDLAAENRDFRGWLRIPGTEVDYPVMQNGDFYLSHGFDGAENPMGVPFLAPDCDPAREGAPLLLYGHNTDRGSLFGPLTQYVSKEFWREHPEISFDTPERYGVYSVFSVFLTTADAESPGAFDFTRCVEAVTPESYARFTGECASRALFDTGVEPAYGKGLLLLVTCEYSVPQGRIVVAAVEK